MRTTWRENHSHQEFLIAQVLFYGISLSLTVLEIRVTSKSESNLSIRFS